MEKLRYLKTYEQHALGLTEQEMQKIVSVEGLSLAKTGDITSIEVHTKNSYTFCVNVEKVIDYD